MTTKYIAEIRGQFPILKEKVHHHPLIYLDNGATTQKPQCVLNALLNYYTTYNANVHRGSYPIADKATEAFEESRESARQLLGAETKEEVIFTKGTTESINLIAATWGDKFVGRGDEVLISHMEHHANIVPWQVLCERKAAKLRVIPINKAGDIMQNTYQSMLNKKTKMVAITHASNVLGTINPVQKMIAQAHQVGAKVLIDGAQMAGHHRIDVRDLNVDFYAFSSHKAYGPMGAGVLYGRREWLETLPPYQTGGEMVKEVRFQQTTYNELPYTFEAGTPNVGAVIALGCAINWLQTTGLEKIAAHESNLYSYARERLKQIKGLRLLGQPERSIGILSFCHPKIHAYDLGQLLGVRGICLRTGHHCAEPLVRFFGTDSAVRMSFAAYNTPQEIDKACEGIENIQKRLVLS